MRINTLILLVVLLSACAPLPKNSESLPKDYAPTPATSGILAEIENQIEQTQGAGQSGFWLLDRNTDALDWRLALLDSAGSSLDVLYYLWYGDVSGRLVLQRVIDAADRGVRVRLLVDDLLLIGSDKALLAIEEHPNIRLRLFNPKQQRSAGMTFDFLTRFDQMNSRMHDKLIVADNRAVILGGRNIGDYYFGLNSHYNFHDLDVLGFGPVARQSSELFDNFWNSDWVTAASELPGTISKQEMAGRRAKLIEELNTSDSLIHIPIEPQDWTTRLRTLLPELHIGSSEIIFDRLEDGEIVQSMRDPLRKMFWSAEKDIRLVNAYIIPDQDFIDSMQQITGKGIDVRILTNSLASHDVPAVNSHYQKWRKPILLTGAELFELRSDPAIKPRVDTAPVVSKFIGLHTKSAVIDGRKVFIGSMNFDPRSADINSEMGVIIDSPSLGKQMIRLAERDMAPENAWQVRLDGNGDLIWVNSDESVNRQPARNTWQRFMDGVFKIFPKSQF
jgi:putative cardiolipin synthase